MNTALGYQLNKYYRSHVKGEYTNTKYVTYSKDAESSITIDRFIGSDFASMRKNYQIFDIHSFKKNRTTFFSRSRR